MYKLRAREDRGKTITDWLKSAHSFSFAQYYDPFNMGFSDLRVINDDIVEPDGGFDTHPHANMEIITVMLSGEIEHKDSTGQIQTLQAGQVQVMSAGSGILHSEMNPSSTTPAHLLQIWILPNKKNTQPYYETKKFPQEKLLNKLSLIVSGSGEKGSLKIRQDAEIYQSVLEADTTLLFDIPENRKLWLQTAKGAIEVNSNILEAGDGLSIVNEQGELEITGVEEQSTFLIFNLRNLTI